MKTELQYESKLLKLCCSFSEHFALRIVEPIFDSQLRKSTLLRPKCQTKPIYIVQRKAVWCRKSSKLKKQDN